MTCTVRFAHGCCGKPAVVTFKTAYGETFAECAEHATGPLGHGEARTPEAKFAIGTRVAVRVYGVTKVGPVVYVGRTRIKVEVATYGGKATRVVTVPMTEAEVI